MTIFKPLGLSPLSFHTLIDSIVRRVKHAQRFLPQTHSAVSAAVDVVLQEKNGADDPTVVMAIGRKKKKEIDVFRERK